MTEEHYDPEQDSGMRDRIAAFLDVHPIITYSVEEKFLNGEAVVAYTFSGCYGPGFAVEEFQKDAPTYLYALEKLLIYAHAYTIAGQEDFSMFCSHQEFDNWGSDDAKQSFVDHRATAREVERLMGEYYQEFLALRDEEE